MRQIILFDIYLAKPDDKTDTEFRALMQQAYKDIDSNCLSSLFFLSQDEFTFITARFESVGLRPLSDERIYNVIFPIEYVECAKHACFPPLDKLGEVELSEWMKQEGVEEAYRFISDNLEWKTNVIRISPKSIVRASGTLHHGLERSEQKNVDNQTWVNFTEVVKETDFWAASDSGWKGSRMMEHHNGQLIFEGWKNGVYQSYRDATSFFEETKNYYLISKFLYNILWEK